MYSTSFASLQYDARGPNGRHRIAFGAAAVSQQPRLAGGHVRPAACRHRQGRHFGGRAGRHIETGDPDLSRSRTELYVAVAVAVLLGFWLMHWKHSFPWHRFHKLCRIL